MDSLCDDVILHIISFIRQKDFYNLLFVKRIKKAIMANQIDMWFEPHDVIYMRTLYVSNLCVQTERLLLSVKHTPNLRKLRYYIPDICDDDICTISEFCEDLTYLDISECKHMTYESIDLISKMKNLRYLRMGWLGKLSISKISQIENLRHLHVYPNHLHDVDLLCISELKMLKVLKVHCDALPETTAALLNMPSLRLLNITSMDMKLVDPYTRCHLTSLDVQTIYNIDDITFVTVFNDLKSITVVNLPPAMMKLLNIEHIHMCDTNFGAHTFDKVEDMKKLKSIEFSDNDYINDNDVIHMLKIKSIERLCLYRSRNITNNCFTNAEEFNNLRCLDISCCVSLTDAVFVNIYKIKQLQKLDISLNNQPTDAAFDGISNLKSLKKLNMCECYSEKLTDNAFIQIATLQNLRQLNMSDCYQIQITDIAFKYISRMSNLNELDVGNCYCIECVCEIAFNYLTNMKSLRCIDVGERLPAMKKYIDKMKKSGVNVKSEC